MLTIEHPLTGEELQVANKDFANYMTWQEAIDACENLGNGWRLPTIEELQGMYEQLYRNGKGDLEECYHCWSSTENGAAGACGFTFNGGNASTPSMKYAGAVRGVRAL
jgi:hypothetical protein